MKAATKFAAFPGLASAEDVGGVSGAAPVRLFAAVGFGWMILIGSVLYRWISAPYFGPTDPGPDPIPDDMLISLRIFEGLMCALAARLLWSCIVKPWWRDGLPGADGVFCLAWLTLWFQDTSMNWIVHVLSYNSHALNFGNWTAEIPGWVSPQSNLVPEPVLAMGFSYFGLATCGAWCAAWIMTKTKTRWPRISNTALIVVGISSGVLLDFVTEVTMISFQLLAYLGVVPALTLWYGTIYQFPLYEAVFFGGVIGSSGVMWYFKDDKGHTWAERGLDKLRIARGNTMKTLVRFLAMVGLLQSGAFFFYTLPMQLFSVNAAEFPAEVPSYLRNGMCGPGTRYECASMQLRPGADEPLPYSPTQRASAATPRAVR